MTPLRQCRHRHGLNAFQSARRKPPPYALVDVAVIRQKVQTMPDDTGMRVIADTMLDGNDALAEVMPVGCESAYRRNMRQVTDHGHRFRRARGAPRSCA